MSDHGLVSAHASLAVSVAGSDVKTRAPAKLRRLPRRIEVSHWRWQEGLPQTVITARRKGRPSVCDWEISPFWLATHLKRGGSWQTPAANWARVCDAGPIRSRRLAVAATFQSPVLLLRASSKLWKRRPVKCTSPYVVRRYLIYPHEDSSSIQRTFNTCCRCALSERAGNVICPVYHVYHV